MTKLPKTLSTSSPVPGRPPYLSDKSGLGHGRGFVRYFGHRSKALNRSKNHKTNFCDRNRAAHVSGGRPRSYELYGRSNAPNLCFLLANHLLGCFRISTTHRWAVHWPKVNRTRSYGNPECYKRLCFKLYKNHDQRLVRFSKK